LLDGVGRGGRHDQHRDLTALPRLEIPQRLVQRGHFVAGQRPGLIDNPPDQRWHRDVGKGRKSPTHHQRKKGSPCSVHRGSQSSAPIAKFANIRGILKDELGKSEHGLSNYFAGAGCGGLKSTFGAVEISFSFSTEKFGFSLYPNAIAVRLVGNERIVTL